MAGTIVSDTVQDGTGNSCTTTQTIFGSAKAWVTFNGTGTIAINASYNVSSLYRNGTGDYTIFLTNAVADTNYAVSVWNNNPMGTLGSGTTLRCGGMVYEVGRSSSAFRIVTFGYVGSTNTGTQEDIGIISVAIFR
jgi:hypothetical protein